MGKDETKIFELKSKPQEGLIGSSRYVAPDPPKGDPYHINHFNTLTIPVEYKIELRLGDIDDLFETDVSSKEDTNGKGEYTGRKARLQCLGLFSRPLNHAESDNCYKVVWKHYREKLHKPALTDAEADKTLVKEVQEQIVRSGKLPEEKKFTKILLPGGYTFWSTWNNAIWDPGYEATYALGADRYVAENNYYTANTVLGKIPLVARAFKKTASGWEPAPGVMLYFEARVPDDLPAYNEGGDPHTQVNAPPLNNGALGTPANPGDQGPRAYMAARRAYLPDAETDIEKKDPQVDNAHKDMGGKRGDPIANNIFLTTSVKGFNEKHAKRTLPHKPYPVPVSADKRTVKVATNEDGETGVIFAPSRVGGDRYKFRVYVGKDTLDSDGKELGATRIDTGTLVVWRTIRLSRYLRHSVPGTMSKTLMDEIKSAPYNWTEPNLKSQRSLSGGVGLIDFTLQGKTSPTWEGASRQYAKAFCEFIVEPQCVVPEDLSTIEAEWKAAFERGLKRTEELQTANPASIPYNIRKLFYFDKATPFTINVHTPKAYNASLGIVDRLPFGRPANPIGIMPGGPDAKTNWAVSAARQAVSNMISWGMLDGFLRHFSAEGNLPGMVVIQGPYGCTWDLIGEKPDDGSGGFTSITTSGVAMNPRGCYLWYCNDTYNNWGIYDLSSNACHEMGHCLYREHAPGGGSGGAQAAYHDPKDICVMSYASCLGQFCGTSIGALQGFDSRAAKFITP